MTRDVPDHAIVGDNPAALIKRRYSEDEVRTLIELARWDWPIDMITTHLSTIADGSVADLRAVAASLHT